MDLEILMTTAKREKIEIFVPYPGQRLEELWSLKSRYLSEEHIMDYPWVIAPHKFKLICLKGKLLKIRI